MRKEKSENVSNARTGNNMKTFEVSFEDNFKAENEEECYEELLQYLKDCVRNSDVTAFKFKEVEK